MKKLLLAASLLFLTGAAHAFDVYSSSSPVANTSGVLCSTGTTSYLYSVCVTSPSANTADSTQVFGSTFSNTTANRPRTRAISEASIGCIVYQANYGVNGLFFAETGGQTHVITYNYLCN